MLRIEDLNNYLEHIVSSVSGLNGHTLVIDEDEFVKKLKDLEPSQMPILLAAYPSANVYGKNIDSTKFANVTIFYILDNIDRSSRTKTQKLTDWQTMQDLTMAVLEQLKADAVDSPYSCSILKDLDVNSIAIDPERNLADCQGWSIGFKLNTN